MNLRTLVLTAALVMALIGMGCSGGGSPVMPDANLGVTEGASHAGQAQTHLWGYYDIYIDIENQTVEAVLNRQAMFAANVVTFLNSNPLAMSFVINDTPIGTDYIDVDIDVGLTHPFPGMPQYHGYDVRGVFMGDGSATMAYNGDLVYPMFGTDQFMFPDPDGGNGAPDGYTRWYNYTEFTGGMDLLSYTQGKMAALDFAGTATLCPYKYFADGLDTHDDLWTWLNDNADQHGQFSSGATNTRNYYLRFPDDKGIMYGYAVIANWEAEDVHPSNAPEAVTCSVVDNSDVYYVDATTNGGNLNLAINVFGWEHQPSTINIESTVLGAVSNFDAATIVTGSGDNYSTYQVEIPADAVTSTGGNEFWVIGEYGAFDYTNEYSVLNDAWENSLAAFFRYDLYVSPEEPGTGVPEFTYTSIYYDGYGPDGTSGNPVPTEWIVDFDASTSTDATTYDWDFDGDGTYEVTGDTSPYISYAYPHDPAETYPVTYQATLKINGDAEISHPIVIARGVYVDDATGSSGGTGEINDPLDTIVNGVVGAIPPGGSIVMVRGDNGSGGQQIYNERIDLTSSHAGIGLQGYSLNDGNSLPPAMRNFEPPRRVVEDHWLYECIYGVEVDGVKVDGFEFENIRGDDGPDQWWREMVQVIYFVDSDDVRVSHIYCHNIWTTSSWWGWKPGYVILLDNCDNAVALNNLFCDGVVASDYGSIYWLRASGGNNLTVTNNTVDNMVDGPWAFGWTKGVIQGVSLSNTTSAQVTNTLLTDITGIRRVDAYGGGGYGIVGSGNTNPLADYCNVWWIRKAYIHPPNQVYDFHLRFDGDITEGANCINPGPANGDYGSDPLYVSGVNDHHLDTGSPCIDTGDPAIQDFDGSQSDMGCYGGPGGDWNFEN